jgi:hypothetical protein
MTSLNDLENLQVPGVGEVDATSPSSHVRLIGGVVLGLSAFGIGQYLTNQLKSRAGADELQASMPEV